MRRARKGVCWAYYIHLPPCWVLYFYNILQATSYQWLVNEHSVEDLLSVNHRRFQGSVLQLDPKLTSLSCAVYIVRIQFNLKINLLYELPLVEGIHSNRVKNWDSLFSSFLFHDFLQKLQFTHICPSYLYTVSARLSAPPKKICIDVK